MTMSQIGIALMLIGGVVAWGSSGIPPGGFKEFSPLLKSYREAKLAGKKPHDDASMAYLKLRQYQVGGSLFAVGALIYLVDLFVKNF